MKTEEQIFAEAISGNVDFISPLQHKLYLHFCEEMRKAVDHGRICTPERMAVLYPIFREINREMDEIDAHWKSFDRIEQRREERRQQRRKEKALGGGMEV
jgi:hypothetical protein